MYLARRINDVIGHLANPPYYNGQMVNIFARYAINEFQHLFEGADDVEIHAMYNAFRTEYMEPHRPGANLLRTYEDVMATARQLRAGHVAPPPAPRIVRVRPMFN